MLNFIKMHGLGNDYIYIDCFKEQVADPEHLAIAVSDRHFGVGGDGLVLIQPVSAVTNAVALMRMFNADGSEGLMCGNAIRCVARYIFDQGYVKETKFNIATASGLKSVTLQVEQQQVASVSIGMGAPIFEPAQIPVAGELSQQGAIELETQNEKFSFYCLSMGNPHAVCFVDEITDHLVLTVGPQIERHPFFPKRVNVSFAKVLSPKLIQMRVWERGSGETMACGTGACAVAVAAARAGLTERQATVKLRGGELQIDWQEQVIMTGPATYAFTGTLSNELSLAVKY